MSCLSLLQQSQTQWLPRLRRAGLFVPLALLMTTLFTSDPPIVFAYSPTSKDYIEIVIANGQYYAYDQGNPNGVIPPGWSGALSEVTKAPRYNLNGGPCTFAPQGQACTFENYTQPGRPCYQKPHEQCIMNARLFQYNLGADMLWELEGFGENTIGGLGGRVVQVSNTNDAGVGSLRWALEQGADTGNPDTPLIVAFAPGLSSTITLERPICVASNKTLDGRGSSVTITKSGLHIANKSNVIINNVTIADVTALDVDCPGESKIRTPDEMGQDGVRVWGSSNVWLHHITFRNAPDGLVDIVSNQNHVASRGITISWSRFENHNKVLLIGDSPTEPADSDVTATVHHNFFNATGQRHPRLRFGKADVFNNYLFQWQTNAMLVTCSGQLRAEANIFEMGPNSSSTGIGYHNDEDTARGCSDGYGAAVGNWARNGGYGLATIASRSSQNVFARPYTAYSLQTQVQGDETFRNRLVGWAGQR